MSLAELFSAGAYRFELGLRRGDQAGFFQARDLSGRILAERARWLAEDPARYAALTAEGEPLLAELSGLATDWLSTPVAPDLAVLGTHLEPDLLLLSPDPEGHHILRGGVLCFPTGWALGEKLGLPLEAVHGVVPGLNAAIGARIHQFLVQLKPGATFLRSNWGLAASGERNLHPARGVPPPQPPVISERIWLRVERQAFVLLPRSRGILLGIRIELHRFDRVLAEPAAAAGLRRALETMPEPLAAYKHIAGVRPELIALLA